MRSAALGLCLSGFLVSALPSLISASLEYSAKTDAAALFRAETLDPPPLATLGKGESLKLLHRGAAQSLVETDGGMKGWMKNADILATASTPGQAVRFGDQQVIGSGDLNVSPIILQPKDWDPDVVSPDRSFLGEIPQAIDREQVEMKHDEN